MEHRATARCSLLGRHWRLQETSAGGMEHRAYRPMLARGQAGMPTLPKALRLCAQDRPGGNGAQGLPPYALYWAGRNAYPT